MKIGIYDPYLDDCGGGEKYMMSIADILSKNNNVSVFWDEKKDFERVKERFNLKLKNVELIQNIFSKKTSFLSRIFESKKYDVIIILSDGSLPFLLSNKLLVHFQRPIEIGREGIFYKFKKNRVKTFFVNSRFTKSFIDKEFNIKAKVIYPPVEIHQKNMKKENIILHVGRFRVVDKLNSVRDYKKQYVLVNAFKDIVDRGLKNWSFILAVSVQDKDYQAFKDLKNLAKNYPIFFEINRSNKDLWDLYSKAKIYWHATGFGDDLEKYPERAEHFGISTVEAMGAGCVPVVINLGGQSEIVSDLENGLLWKTIPELIEKTLILVSSDKLRNKLSQNAKKRAKDFSFEIFSKNINELIS